jgi:hypothetical protein
MKYMEISPTQALSKLVEWMTALAVLINAPQVITYPDYYFGVG